MSRDPRDERTATGRDVTVERTSERTRPERTMPGAIDEEVPDLGPDGEGGGILDPPAEFTATGEETIGVEGALGVDERVGSANAALLAWIAAPPAGEPPAPAHGEPVAAIKKAIADLPLDPLPSLDRDLGKVMRILDPPVRVVPPPPPAVGPLAGAEPTEAVAVDANARWRAVALSVLLVLLAAAAAARVFVAR